MATVNPLLYSDNSEHEALSMPDAGFVEPPKKGAFAGFGSAMATTAENSASAVWSLGNEMLQRSIMGDKAYQAVQKAAPDLNMPKMEKIDPLQTGVAAQILAPLVQDVGLTLAGPVGWMAAATAAGARERATTYQELREKGVDAGTAHETANVKGAEVGGMYGLTRIPLSKQIAQIGSRALRWGSRAAVGVATQTGLDYLGGETRGAILEAHGYSEQAKQMTQWDTMRFVSDIAGGALLGLTSNAHVSDEAATAARWWQQADSLNHESAPGLPTDPISSGVTADATTSAVNQINAGQPVNVSEIPSLHDAQFLAYNDKNIAEARSYLSDHEKVLTHYDGEIKAVQEDISKARKDGHDDIADYLESEELPRLQQVRRSTEELADRWRDDIARMEDPEGLSPFQRNAKPALEEHRATVNEIATGAREYAAPREEISTPATQADKGREATPANVVDEARQLLNDYKNPVSQAIEEQAYAGEGVQLQTKLTPAQQELVNMHTELRKLATDTGDAELHQTLDAAMAEHQAEHMEANQFNVAALCAIGG